MHADAPDLAQEAETAFGTPQSSETPRTWKCLGARAVARFTRYPYHFDEVANGVSTGTIALNGYSDLTVDTVLNANLLTTLAYQRIQNLVTKSVSNAAGGTF